MEWISVKDRMPEDYQRVLCLFESGTMEVSFRASVKGFCYEGFKQTGKVTHWMPLPKKPKGTSMERITSNRPWAEAQKNLSNEMGYSHIWTRLNAIEDILGEDYDLDRLRELVEADREKRCVIFRKGYGVVSEYEVDEEGVITRTATGVVTRDEYDRVLKGDANG